MTFERPTDLVYNRGPVADPNALAEESGAASWLFLCGPAFADMDGGMSYAQAEAAVPDARCVVSDPPTELDMDLARQQIAALDELPRPTLVTCRGGPHTSGLVYLYAGLRSGASADEVIANAEADDAPFTASPEITDWVRQGLADLA